MLTTKTIDLTRAEAEATGVITGEVTNVDLVTKLLDVEIDAVEYIGIPAHYHCKVDNADEGYRAFEIEDKVLLLNKKPNGPIAATNLTVIGFADGYPRFCTDLLILYSAAGGNPSTFYSAKAHVLWSVRDQKIVMGPCSLMELEAAGYIDSLEHLYVVGHGVSGDSFIDWLDDTNSSLSASYTCGALGLACPSQDYLDGLYIYETMPDFDNSCTISGTYPLTDPGYYNAISWTELEGYENGYIDIEYTLQAWGDRGHLQPPLPDPEYVIDTYTSFKNRDVVIQTAKCLAHFGAKTNDRQAYVMSRGGFVNTHNDYSFQESIIGRTGWYGDPYFIAVFSRRYKETEIEEIENVSNLYYSPIGLLASIPYTERLTSTSIVEGTTTTFYESVSSAYTHVCEIYPYSFKSSPIKTKINGVVSEQKVATAVYVLSGDINAYENGSKVGTTRMIPKVNVSVEVIDADIEYNPFLAANIESLASAIDSALSNAGAESVSILLFKGPIL